MTTGYHNILNLSSDIFSLEASIAKRGSFMRSMIVIGVLQELNRELRRIDVWFPEP
jgi:hypothetical protein